LARYDRFYRPNLHVIFVAYFRNSRDSGAGP